jgi:hypothetical protein
MADAGVIHFEKDRNTVQGGEHLAYVTRFLPEESDAGSAGRSSGMLTTVTTCIERIRARLLDAKKPLGVS